MATDEVDTAEESPAEDSAGEDRDIARVGSYTWPDFLEEYGYEDAAAEVRQAREAAAEDPEYGTIEERPVEPDWDDLPIDPETYLGFHPETTDDRVTDALQDAAGLQAYFDEFLDPSTTPIVKDQYLWEHLKQEFYYEPDGARPRDAHGEIIPFDETQSQFLQFDHDDVEGVLSFAEDQASDLKALVDERTVNVNPEVDEDEFFSTVDGQTTIANRYDLEKAVSFPKKTHFREIERYWVNKPYAFVILFHSEKENEKKYYVIEPYRNEIESTLQEFLTGKLRTAIKYASEDVVTEGAEQERRDVIEDETRKLLERYDLYEGPVTEQQGMVERLLSLVGRGEDPDRDRGIEGIPARPEPVVLEEDADTLTQYQVEKLLYVLKRNFIGYERIDGIKHDINIEDISCDGYNSPVFVYHTDYENIITNIEHGVEELDDFVVKLAQRSGKGISKRQPQVDATLPDGSRAQLTLGTEVSDHGTNYTIRQFNDVPFTPIDLVNWKTFSLEEMAFLWLCIENEMSLIFAGGTASGKTTSLNAASLFIPSNTKIVSIEDTREVTLPQRNWIASVTRPSFSEDDRGDIDEFDLLEAALRQRPDYIVMGEVRGEEGRTLFQVMSTGHVTYTTFHADTVGEVLKRFTTDPINVSKTLFTALDLVSIQTATRVQGRKVRRNRVLTEINEYNAENDEINVQDVFQWLPEHDEFQRQPASNTLEEIMFDRGWDRDTLESELFKRRVILAYLIDRELNSYTEVAATVQAFINDPETILTLLATDQLEDSLADLRGMESVEIDVDQDKEDLIPRPDPAPSVREQVDDILAKAREDLFPEYKHGAADLQSALVDVEKVEDIVVEDTGTQPDEETDDTDDGEDTADDTDGFAGFESVSFGEDTVPSSSSSEEDNGE